MKAWIHIIGVCGKAMAPIAVMFKERGYFVTGSDHQFLPPASTLIEDAQIPYVQSYHYTHLTRDFWHTELSEQIPEIREIPDRVIVNEALSQKNKEYLFAKNKELDVRPYSQVLGELFVKPESIVVAGTAGKTTTTAILVFLFTQLGIEPTYMIGAEAVDIEKAVTFEEEGNWSILEGDEYFSHQLARGPKFLEYRPKYAIITNVGYEHQDVYPTREQYEAAFVSLAENVPNNGLLVLKHDNHMSEKFRTKNSARVISYALVDSPNQAPEKAWYCFYDTTRKEYCICTPKHEEIITFSTNLLGEFVVEDMLAAVTLLLNVPAHQLPIDFLAKGTGYLQDIGHALSSFRGVRKRLEYKINTDSVTIIDDFGIAPHRARNSLETVRNAFPESTIVAVFEPNSGSRFADVDAFMEAYTGTFNTADQIIIPDLSTFNPDLATAEEFVDRLGELGHTVQHISQEYLVLILQKLIETSEKHVVIVFFSSYRLNGVIDTLLGGL